jgi:hypothetical protein
VILAVVFVCSSFFLRWCGSIQQFVKAPNNRPGVDAGWPRPLAYLHSWPRATQAGRYAV